LTASDFDEFDYIIAMDDENIDNIRRILPRSAKCTVKLLLDYADGGIVDDPYFTLDFDKAYEDIEKGCRGLLDEIRKNLR
ncbi:MAG: low molecular weight phosphotyrosine protein phosphatase, partial [Candidatus Methanomethylophilaceae archaeon]|nr:low molecular weight phosphotyrosine protein phosphatase [Candidatus Methanomethylophilaceae archaeon]